MWNIILLSMVKLEHIRGCKSQKKNFWQTCICYGYSSFSGRRYLSPVLVPVNSGWGRSRRLTAQQKNIDFPLYQILSWSHQDLGFLPFDLTADDTCDVTGLMTRCMEVSIHTAARVNTASADAGSLADVSVWTVFTNPS